MAVMRSVMFSVLASALATVVARRLLSVSHPPEEVGKGRLRRGRGFVIVVPVLVGNSNNRIGWVKEVHYHPRPLFGRAAS